MYSRVYADVSSPSSPTRATLLRPQTSCHVKLACVVVGGLGAEAAHGNERARDTNDTEQTKERLSHH